MTKNLFLFFAFFILGAFSAAAQTDRGRLMAGGSFNYKFPSRGEGNIRRSNFTGEPSIGFFVADNVVLGFAVPITASREQDVRDGSIERNSAVAFAPFGRYYFGAANIKPFLEARFGFQRFKYSYTGPGGPSEGTDNALFVGMGGGIAFFLNEHVALEPKLSFDAYSRNNTTTALHFNLGFQVYF